MSECPTTRVLKALDEHTLLPVIAAAAELQVPLALRILLDLQRHGVVEQFAEGCWGKAA